MITLTSCSGRCAGRGGARDPSWPRACPRSADDRDRSPCFGEWPAGRRADLIVVGSGVAWLPPRGAAELGLRVVVVTSTRSSGLHPVGPGRGGRGPGRRARRRRRGARRGHTHRRGRALRRRRGGLDHRRRSGRGGPAAGPGCRLRPGSGGPVGPHPRRRPFGVPGGARGRRRDRGRGGRPWGRGHRPRLPLLTGHVALESVRAADGRIPEWPLLETRVGPGARAPPLLWPAAAKGALRVHHQPGHRHRGRGGAGAGAGAGPPT